METLPSVTRNTNESILCSISNACVANSLPLNTSNISLTGFKSEKAIVLENGNKKTRSIHKIGKCIESEKPVNKLLTKNLVGSFSGRNMSSQSCTPRTLVPRTCVNRTASVSTAVVPTVGILPRPEVIQCVTVMSGKSPMYGLFFGAFCVNSGKQIANRRFRTECQVSFYYDVLWLSSD